MKARMMFAAAMAALALAALTLPAVAHDGSGGHTTINLNCSNPSPNTAGSYSDNTCSWVFPDDFGNTSTDKVDKFEIQLPVNAAINTDENSSAADGHDDPDDGQQVGATTVATDLSYDGCGDNNDGGTYNTYWEDTWTTFTVPSGWTKVAQFNTVFTVLFFFTENVPSHVIKNNTTGQFAIITDIPESRGCDGADPSFNMTTYSHEGNNSANEWVSKNPTTAGTYNVKLIATEVSGTTHDDIDAITIR